MIELAGFVDAHVHMATAGAPLGVTAAELRARGVVAAVEAGTSGAVDFEAAAQGWRAALPTRVFANVVPNGLRGERKSWGEPPPDPVAVLRGLRPDGVKVRLGESPHRDDLQDLLNAQRAAAALGVALMVHVTGARLPPERLLDALRAGDVLTHCYTRSRGKTFAIIDDDGRILKAAWAARERGVAFDVGASGRHFAPEVARAAVTQGFLATFISSDASSWAFLRTIVPDMPEPLHVSAVARILVESGMPFDEALAAVTTRPAAFFGFRLPSRSSDDHVAIDERFQLRRVVRDGTVLFEDNADAPEQTDA
jgi:dihydroorotase